MDHREHDQTPACALSKQKLLESFHMLPPYEGSVDTARRGTSRPGS